MSDNYLEVAKILTYTALSFFVALWWAPSLISLLCWLKFWKKRSRSIAMTGEKLTVTKDFYAHDEAHMKVPRAGGILIWVTTIAFAFCFWLLLKIDPENKLFQYLNFVSRQQTFIPIATLFFASTFGFIDDALSTLETGGNYKAGGLKLSQRLMLVSTLSLFIGLWFYDRLKIRELSIFAYNLRLDELFGLNLSWLIVPITVIILVGLWGSSVIDGFDGLAIGVLIPVYLCLAALAYVNGYYNIANLLMVMVGSMAAFLWFNIPPAKFYLGDTGSLGLLMTIGVVAILIDKIYILPITGIMLVLTVGSNVVQVFSKKVFKRKVFLAAPLHHHFQGKGLTKEQITLRYWLVSIIFSMLALVVGLLIN